VFEKKDMFWKFEHKLYSIFHSQLPYNSKLLNESPLPVIDQFTIIKGINWTYSVG